MSKLNLVLLTILLFANALLFCIMIYFSKNRKDNATRLGFGFMEVVTFADMAVILWRMFG